MASCAPNPPDLKQEAPLFIEESEFEKLKQRFDLFSVQRAEDYLGGLSPQLPIAKALKRDCNGSGLYQNGGRLNACVMYIVQNGPDDYSLIQNAAEAARVFAPIESREEAVSYAAMLTGYDVIYQLPTFESNWRYYNNSILPTLVTESDFGYKLNLEYYQFFGCGPHPHFQVDLTLSQGGVLQEDQRTKLYEEPDKDGLCVD